MCGRDDEKSDEKQRGLEEPQTNHQTGEKQVDYAKPKPASECANAVEPMGEKSVECAMRHAENDDERGYNNQFDPLVETSKDQRRRRKNKGAETEDQTLGSLSFHPAARPLIDLRDEPDKLRGISLKKGPAGNAETMAA